MKSRHFDGDHLLPIAMPMGGLGAGCICLSGNGSLQDFSIRHVPATTALADGHDSTDTAFGLLHVRGNAPITRLIEGPLPRGKIYDQGLKAQGYRLGGYEGLPRFRHCTFDAAYPFGRVSLRDNAIPLHVSITGFSPFIPLDDVNSGIPCAILEYQFENPTDQPVEFDFSYHLSHLAQKNSRTSTNAPLDDFGVALTNKDDLSAASFGSAAFGMIGVRPLIKTMWLRGNWFDAMSALWREVDGEQFTPNQGGSTPVHWARNGASVSISLRLAPGEAITVPVVIAWHFPNVYQAYSGSSGIGWCEHGHKPPSKKAWHPFYTTQWADASAVALYVRDNYDSLRNRTTAFRGALDACTVPVEVIDAASANLAILKSPTVLRQANGNIWAWEGCFTDAGCCHGSCTHVWNYAQAMPQLFPPLERTLREQELLRSMDDVGHVDFRSSLPDGPTAHQFHAAADGQLGGIMKLYRDWHISGDTGWMSSLYPAARRSLEFCIRQWDPDERGGLYEPHHNTYDIEFWGPDGMCTSIYLGALIAAEKMAAATGNVADAGRYRSLASKCAALMTTRLFNGDYFQQEIDTASTRDSSFRDAMAACNEQSSEVDQLMKAEGPRYQYGSGCLADGIIGAWMAAIYDLPLPLDRTQVRQHLKAVFENNFKPDLSDHVCLQRPGYANGAEPGLLICTWPRGGKPTLPFVYSDEVWTGIEYQVASHLFEEGLIDEGLTLVRAVRSRYDGLVRNPFNEYECGSYYARAMASFALLNSLAGLHYSAVTRTLRFQPKLSGSFTTVLLTASAFGTVSMNDNEITIQITEGDLIIERLSFDHDRPMLQIPLDKQRIVAGQSATFRKFK